MMLVHESLKRSAGRSPESIAIITIGGRDFSYIEFYNAVLRLAGDLHDLGAQPGDRIGLYLNKHILSALLPYACSMLGCIFVPINPVLKEDQIRHIVTDCDIKLLVSSSSRLAVIGSSIDYLRSIVLCDGDDSVQSSAENYFCWNEGNAVQTPSRDFDVDINEDDVFALLYTSGSTGPAKGVIISHRNAMLGADSVNTYLNLTSADVTLACLPFSFDYGLNQLLSAVFTGASCVLFDYLLPSDVVKAIAQHQVTGLAGVPTFWHQLMKTDWQKHPPVTLRYITNSGGRLSLPMIRQLVETLPSIEIFSMYGLTEAFRATYLDPSEITARPLSIGKAIPHARIMVLDDDNGVVPPGGEGELVQAGPLVSGGYWHRSEETKKVFKKLPSHLSSVENEIAVYSGDLVTVDLEGFLYFVGRKDGMIKSAGFRISPEEVEDVLYESDSVYQAGVFGVPDDSLGQAVVAAVTFHEGEAGSVERLMQHCREKLPSYMVPKEIRFCDQIPKNPNGKVDRRALALDFVS